jgi:hypothetical protein
MASMKGGLERVCPFLLFATAKSVLGGWLRGAGIGVRRRKSRAGGDDDEGKNGSEDKGDDDEEQHWAAVASLLARAWGRLFHGWCDACFDLPVVRWRREML